MTTKPLSNDARHQRAAILQHLQERGRGTTLELREVLGIMSPASRIMELRRAGWDIGLHWEYAIDTAGVTHRQGVYYLKSGNGGK